MGEYASGDAAAALARAAQLGATVRKRSRWFVWYQVVFGCVAAVIVLVAGLVQAPYGAQLSGGLGAALAAGLAVYAARQPVARRGFAVRHSIFMGAWVLLYLAVLLPGAILFHGNAAWWVPGAVVVSLPGLIGGYLEARK
ncbi:hypothetical protein [Streptomyces sp. NPDC093707]|uniref:hypothetical protein n=1 Tax=Streptomyces sp. NPDC093707 TaxID=3154984 RepID=UPI0034507C0C